MPRKSKTTSFDSEEACRQLVELGVRRKQFMRASIRVSNAAGALVRRALGWQPSLDAKEQKRINASAAKILASEDYSELPAELEAIANALAADIATSREMVKPAEVMVHKLELQMRKTARQFPVWDTWAKDIKGFSDLGLAVVIAEAGGLERYPDCGKLWKRLGLAPVSKDGKTQACSTWRKSGGLTADDWKDESSAGPKYAPRRRAAIFSQVGSPIIGGMGKGYRPAVGEDITQNEKLSYYERVFVERLRFEAAKDADMRRPDTEAGKESYSRYAAMRAQRYTEKRLLKHLWQAWRRAALNVAEGPAREVPAANPSAQAECSAIIMVLPSEQVPSTLHPAKAGKRRAIRGTAGNQPVNILPAASITDAA